MKKQLLLGSTALIVGALAAPGIAAAEDPVRLEVRGYALKYFGLGDIDNDSNSGQNTTAGFSDGEIHFKGSATLDNGLTVGVHVELEGNQSGDQIDEEYAWLSGDFGKVVIGSENLPDYLTFWGVTAPYVGVPINSGWLSIWAPLPSGIKTGFRSSMQTTNLTLTNDTFQIGYQSPRFSGFQFVAGYAPTDAKSGSSKNAPTDEDVEIHDVISVGANFKENFNGVDMGLAVGYERGEGSDGTPDVVPSPSDPQIYKGGISIGAGGFTLAGSYGVYDSDGSDDGVAWDAGVKYSTGPWGVSATYLHGEEEGTAGGGDDEVDAFVGAVSYAVGPGIKASLSLIHVEWDDEAGVVASESTVGVLGIAVSF